MNDNSHCRRSDFEASKIHDCKSKALPSSINFRNAYKPGPKSRQDKTMLIQTSIVNGQKMADHLGRANGMWLIRPIFSSLYGMEKSTASDLVSVTVIRPIPKSAFWGKSILPIVCYTNFTDKERRYIHYIVIQVSNHTNPFWTNFSTPVSAILAHDPASKNIAKIKKIKNGRHIFDLTHSALKFRASDI